MTTTASDVDVVFKALADPTRRALLDLLFTRPRTTGELVDEFPHLSRYAIMKHLDVLDEAGLIIITREGRHRWNRLNAMPIRLIYERWVSKYADRWSQSMTQLKRLCEDDSDDRAARDR